MLPVHFLEFIAVTANILYPANRRSSISPPLLIAINKFASDNSKKEKQREFHSDDDPSIFSAMVIFSLLWIHEFSQRFAYFNICCASRKKIIKYLNIHLQNSQVPWTLSCQQRLNKLTLTASPKSFSSIPKLSIQKLKSHFHSYNLQPQL